MHECLAIDFRILLPNLCKETLQQVQGDTAVGCAGCHAVSIAQAESTLSY